MTGKPSLTGISFTENGMVDAVQLNTLYQIIGWDRKAHRTIEKTDTMLRVSHYYIAAHTNHGQLVGFARVCGDPYVVQVLDVITHPDYRRRGIGTRCMLGILNYLQHSSYISVTLTDGSGVEDFYQRFGFRSINDDTQIRVWHRDAGV